MTCVPIAYCSRGYDTTAKERIDGAEPKGENGCQPEGRTMESRQVMCEQDNGHLVRNLSVVAGMTTALLVVVLIVPEMMRDRWELNNRLRVLVRLDEADNLQQSNYFGAYKIYDEVLKEAQQHKIVNDELTKALASAAAWLVLAAAG